MTANKFKVGQKVLFVADPSTNCWYNFKGKYEDVHTITSTGITMGRLFYRLDGYNIGFLEIHIKLALGVTYINPETGERHVIT